MFCPKCGDPIEANEIFCNKCGNQLRPLPNMQQQNINAQTFNTSQTNNQANFNNLYNVNNQYSNNNEKQQTKNIIVGLVAGIGVVAIIFCCVFMFGRTNYYFPDEGYGDNNGKISTSKNNTNQNKSKYRTIIVTDNTYSGMKISNSSDAIKLIEKDSNDQKSSCSSEIRDIEEKIKDYGIIAVNLCEMDTEFAKEVGNVFKMIYKEYPSVRGHLTNLSLINTTISEGYIAAFMPIFDFATSDTISSYPWVIKTQILLNTSYFLNPTRLKDSVTDGSNSGHFPPNATIYSPVAHELGHYLSFLAMMRHYDVESILLIENNNVDKLYKLYEDFEKGDFSLSMIKEAYNNYKKDTNTKLSLDEWRATISQYAVAKDNSGKYIYDETIAEGFHDVYLNGDKAKDASKYVVAVLKKKLKG